MAISLVTNWKLDYQFYPCGSGQIRFRVKAPHDAHVALSTGPQAEEPTYEICIGGWGNTKSFILKNGEPEPAEADTPEILSADDFRIFWMRWNKDEIVIGKEGNSMPFLTYRHYRSPEPCQIGYFGVRTGWGAEGEWVIDEGIV